MLTVADWKRYDAAERERMGERALRDLVEAVAPLPVRTGDAVIVPHTRLEVTGEHIGRAVATAIASGAERVLAIGVLHGMRRDDPSVRDIHREDRLAADEFSLDAFVELMELAAPNVDVMRRYPLLAGEDPASLAGIEELERIVAAGAFLVATTDPVHHGHAYGTPEGDCLDAGDPDTRCRVERMVAAQLDALSNRAFADFATLCDDHKSDFRDSGPVLAQLLGDGFGWQLHDLALVDYSTALDAPTPSWVAGALVATGVHVVSDTT